VAVGPARGLRGDRRDRRERRDGLTRFVEDDVVRRSREPQQRVVLGGRHAETVRAGHRLVVAVQAGRRRGTDAVAPQLRSHADDEVDPADRRAGLAEVGQAAHQLTRVRAVVQVELEVGVRGGAEREDSGLRRALARDHACTLARRGGTPSVLRVPLPAT
jgi:hypothetical protein